jgi:hypothetical protein
MAEHGDMKAHEKTYTGVMALLKWGTVASLLATMIVVLLIAN